MDMEENVQAPPSVPGTPQSPQYVPGTPPTVHGTPATVHGTPVTVPSTLPSTPQSPPYEPAPSPPPYVPAPSPPPDSPQYRAIDIGSPVQYTAVDNGSSVQYTAVDNTTQYKHTLRKLYDHRVQKHQLNTFWYAMESIGIQKIQDNTTLTRLVVLELSRRKADNPIIATTLLSRTEREMDENELLALYLQVCEETKQRMDLLGVFYDSVASYISGKSDRLADGMVATKLVELLNRFRPEVMAYYTG